MRTTTSTTTAEAARAVAGKGEGDATHEVWESAPTQLPAAASAKKTSAPTSVADAVSAAIAIGATVGNKWVEWVDWPTRFPVRADDTASAVGRGRGSKSHGSAAATASRDDERCVEGADHEAAATATTAREVSAARHTGAGHGDLQDLTRGQVEIAADLSAQTTRTSTTKGRGRRNAMPTLGAKGEDLIGIGSRHHEGNQGPGVGEIKDDRTGMGRRLERDKRQQGCPSEP
jgi:hypothetical protein